MKNKTMIDIKLMPAPRTNQPAPKKSEGDCWKNLIDRYGEDNIYKSELYREIRIDKLISLNRLMIERRNIGIDRYKTVLQPFNGRDCVRDLLEEQLDSLAYSEQVSLEYPKLEALMLEYQKVILNYMSKLLDSKEKSENAKS